MSELVTVARAARLLGVSKKRVYVFINQGRVDSLKFGPRITRITMDSISAFIASRLAHQKSELGLDMDIPKKPAAGQAPPSRHLKLGTSSGNPACSPRFSAGTK